MITLTGDNIKRLSLYYIASMCVFSWRKYGKSNLMSNDFYVIDEALKFSLCLRSRRRRGNLHFDFRAKALKLEEDHVLISPTFYAWLFCTKVLCEAFLKYILGLSFFGARILAQVRSHKMLVKLTTCRKVRKEIAYIFIGHLC